MTPEDIHGQYNTGPIDSSAAWNHFASLLNSRGYELLHFIGDDAQSPQVDTTEGLGNPFSPSPNGPFHGNIGFAGPSPEEYDVLPTDVRSFIITSQQSLNDPIPPHPAIRRVPEYARPTFANDVLEYHIPQLEFYLKKMLNMDPTKRPTAKEALHRFKAARNARPLHI
ncbi:hypothetical protein BU17DRAFT_82178 [Hysterangium stoloniferum]|nr:hypothetical protein BU17DRAFT_82178 [Hysterangium stoloniferum]